VDGAATVDHADRGGHFAALEAPGTLTADLRDFFGSLT
jgi:hypothetical protein